MCVRKCRKSYFLFLCSVLLSGTQAAFHLQLMLDSVVVVYLFMEFRSVQIVESRLI